MSIISSKLRAEFRSRSALAKLSKIVIRVAKNKTAPYDSEALPKSLQYLRTCFLTLDRKEEFLKKRNSDQAQIIQNPLFGKNPRNR